MDLLSNVAFLETGEDGLPSPTFHGGEGRYHVLGSLMTTLPTSVRKLKGTVPRDFSPQLFFMKHISLGP